MFLVQTVKEEHRRHEVGLLRGRTVAHRPLALAEEANLHPTQVTRHLRALTRAGLVTAERQGRFVAYRLNNDALTTLGTDLLTLIMR